MKFNITINQKAFMDMGSNLDLTDMAILDYLYILCSTPNERVEQQRVTAYGYKWTWVNFQALLIAMPALRIKSTGAITPRLRKIAEEKYISLRRIGNQRLYIRLLEKTDKLFISVNGAIHDGEQLYSKSYSRRSANNTNNDNTNKLGQNVSLPVDKYAELGSNPLFREYCSERPTISFKEWVNMHG